MKPLAVSMKYESIDTYCLVSRYADPIDEIFLVTDGTNGRQKPAIAVVSLPDIIGGSIVNVELWSGKNILSSLSVLSTLRLEDTVNSPTHV